MSLSTELSSDFSNMIRSRGGEYYRAGQVKIKHGCDWDVDASVRGGMTYRVRLEREKYKIHIYCSCPYFESGGPCKHIWAVILAADEMGYLKGDGRKAPLILVEGLIDDDEDDDDFDEDDAEYEKEDSVSDLAKLFDVQRIPPQPKNKLLNWKEQLAAFGRTGANAGSGK